MSRQADFRSRFRANLEDIKRLYGFGQYSYTEGMTRRIARRIARTAARAKRPIQRF